MDHNNLKRRRLPQGFEPSSPELDLQDLAYTSSAGFADGQHLNFASGADALFHQPVSVTLTEPLSFFFDPEAIQHRLQEAAAAQVRLPVRDLRQSYQIVRYRQKKPRQSSGMSNAAFPPPGPLVTEGQDDGAFLDQPDGSSSSSTWTTGLADCLGACQSFTGPEPPSSFAPLSSTSSYSFTPLTLYREAAQLPTGPETSSNALSAAGADSTPSFLQYDDQNAMTEMMRQFPPLQPMCVMAAQPSARNNAMVYPDTGDDPAYAVGLQMPFRDAVPAISGHPHLSSPPQASSLAGGYGPPFEATGQMGGALLQPPPLYDVAPTYEAQGPLAAAPSFGPPEAAGPYQVQRVSTASRRGPFKSQEAREKTAETRKMGSCVRCKLQRIRCPADELNKKAPCLECQKHALAASIKGEWKLPCLRWKLTDVKLYKPGQVQGHEWTKRWQDTVAEEIGAWLSDEIKEIRVTEGLTGKSVKLMVRQFVPQPGDKLDRSWVSPNGARNSIKIPPYAIVDMEAAKGAFEDYITDGLQGSYKAWLGPREKLLWRTYTVATKRMNNPALPSTERDLLVRTFKLWMSIRLTTKSFEIVGPERLGMPTDLIMDRDNPLYGKTPLPPVMGAQIDSFLIHKVQADLKKETLDALQKIMTVDKKPKSWLTMYLVSFILLHNIALITKHDADYAKKHGINRRFAREDKVKEYNMGAMTLLTYFHYCNKGKFPFSKACKETDLRELAELDEDMVAYIRQTKQHAAEHKRQWEDLWATDEYTNEYYYLSQLFEDNWQPRTMA